MDQLYLAIPDSNPNNSGKRSIQSLSTHEYDGLATLASTLGIISASAYQSTPKPSQLVQLLSCKQEIGGRSLWNANGLFTKSYKCLEEAARAFRALCTKLVAALGMALLSLAGAASEPRIDAAAALLRGGPSSAADAAAGAGAPPKTSRAVTSAEIGERLFLSLGLIPNRLTKARRDLPREH